MRTTVVAAALGACVSVALLLLQPAHVWAGGSPTPEATETVGGVPTAPTQVQLNLGTRTISWTDVSDDETGFRVTFEITEGGEVVHSETYTVAANVTAAQISEAAPSIAGDVYRVTVVGFNDAGDSAPALLSRSNEGGLIPATPTPTPSARATSVPVGLPETGSGDGVFVCDALCSAAASLALVAAGFTLIAIGRASFRRDTWPSRSRRPARRLRRARTRSS